MKNYNRFYVDLDIFQPKKVKSNCNSPWVIIAFTVRWHSFTHIFTIHPIKLSDPAFSSNQSMEP